MLLFPEQGTFHKRFVAKKKWLPSRSSTKRRLFKERMCICAGKPL